MKKLTTLLGLAMALAMVSCSSTIERKKSKLLEQQTFAVEALANFESDKSCENAICAYNIIKEVGEGVISGKKESEYIALDNEVNCIKKQLKNQLEKGLYDVAIPLSRTEDSLIEKGKTQFAVKLQKRDVVKYTYDCNTPINLNIYNADRRVCIKQHATQRGICDSLAIPNTAIYIFEVDNPVEAQYISYSATRHCMTMESFMKDVTTIAEVVPAMKGDFMSFSKNEYQVTNLFQEPRKITLRGSWKAAWSGHKRTIVALNIPSNSVNVAYQLRIDTSEGTNYQDGKFFSKVKSSTTKVEILGITVKEKTTSHTSLLRELLSKMETPRRVEEAYCSMYVFYNEKDAQKFAGDVSRDVKNYDVNYSIIGTQSCNGSIPVSGRKNVYLCFENDQFSGSIYLWLEAVATTTETNYYKYIYK